jgi:hypothetical protein
MEKYRGEIIVQFTKKPAKPDAADRLLELEMWLNYVVANSAYEKFGVGIRVHLSDLREK